MYKIALAFWPWLHSALLSLSIYLFLYQISRSLTTESMVDYLYAFSSFIHKIEFPQKTRLIKMTFQANRPNAHRFYRVRMYTSHQFNLKGLRHFHAMKWKIQKIHDFCSIGYYAMVIIIIYLFIRNVAAEHLSVFTLYTQLHVSCVLAQWR